MRARSWAPGRDLLADPLLGLLLGGCQGQHLGLLALAGPLRGLLQLVQAGPGQAQVLAQLHDLGLRLEGRTAQLVRLQPGRRRQQAQAVKGLLVLADLARQLGVLVAVGQVGRGVREDVGERLGREDLVEQGGVLGPGRLREAHAEGLAAGPEVLLAVGQLLLQEPQGEVRLALLVDQLRVAILDAVEAVADLLDALLDGLLVGVDVPQLRPRGGQLVAGGGLLALELVHELLRLADGRGQLFLPILRGGDLILEAGAEHRRWCRHRQHQEGGEHEHREQGPGHTGPVLACGHARHDRVPSPLLLQ